MCQTDNLNSKYSTWQNFKVDFYTFPFNYYAIKALCLIQFYLNKNYNVHVFHLRAFVSNSNWKPRTECEKQV